jgi:HNH endonuclease
MRASPRRFKEPTVTCRTCGVTEARTGTYQLDCRACQIAKRTCPQCGKVADRRQKRAYRCRDCYSQATNAEGHPLWKGGRTLSKGYVLVHQRAHPRADKNGYVREHIVNWELAHGQPLPDGWVVHHLNGIKHDNRPENLVGLPTLRHDRLLPLMRARIRHLEAQLAQALERPG